jgi:hypothetical protein
VNRCEHCGEPIYDELDVAVGLCAAHTLMACFGIAPFGEFVSTATTQSGSTKADSDGDDGA